MSPLGYATGNGSVGVCVVGDLNLPAFNWDKLILYLSSKFGWLSGVMLGNS